MSGLLLVTDLTMMYGGRVCIVGLDTQLRSVRLVRPDFIHEHDLLIERKRNIHPRGVYQFAIKRKTEREAPHLEDYVWLRKPPVQFIRDTPTEKWHAVLEQTCHPSVAAIFSTSLQHDNRNIRAGTGTSSVGTFKPTSIDNLYYQSHKRRSVPQFRLAFSDNAGNAYDLPINDFTFLRLVDAQLQQIETRNMDWIMARLLTKFQQLDLWLRVGVTRNYYGWCWLQISAIHTIPDYLHGRTFTDFLP